jgi:hypothetical protein
MLQHQDPSRLVYVEPSKLLWIDFMAHPSCFATMKAARSLIGRTAHLYGASRRHREAENGAFFDWSRVKSLCLIVDSILIVVDSSDDEDKGGEYLKNSPLWISALG